MPDANTNRLAATWDLLESWNADGHCRAISAETGSVTGEVHSFVAGHLGADNTNSVTRDSVFLIASPTKPFVTTAAMMLVEQGQLQLDHFVGRYLPEFASDGKEAIRLIHLLTHTSGLPDMLPNNESLRQEHAPLSTFMRYVCEVELVARPGTKVHYQSMGILVLATIVERLTGLSLPGFLQKQIFEPLCMSNTALGIPTSWHNSGHMDRMAWSQVDSKPGATDWGWNSSYWRGLGAPWGGLLSTATDLGNFCRHLLRIHHGEDGILSHETLCAMTTNQLEYLGNLPEGSVRATPWGLGWQLNWPGHSRGFGSLLPPECYGHWGATGTLVWIDPTRHVYGIVLTTEPIDMENRRQIAFANMSSLVWPR